VVADERAGSGRWLGHALYPRPDTAEVQACLQACAPPLADATVEFFAEGWEFWAFSAGDYVIRSPKTETGRAVLAIDQRLLPELARYLTTPVPFVDVYCENGPNGQPLAGHRRVAGIQLPDDGRGIGPGFGRELGTLLRQLRSFPVDRAVALGVAYIDGPALKARRIRHYAEVKHRVLPLLSPVMRQAVAGTFEAYLDDPANFDFRPCLTHQDLDSNVLIDPASGSISGLIDFSATVVGKPAVDFWLPLAGFARLGIADQLPACLEAAGISSDEAERMLPEVRFWNLRYPLLGTLHGLDIGDHEYVRETIRELEKALSQQV
jgi:aminoglycoside 2''-phosphotransferase